MEIGVICQDPNLLFTWNIPSIFATLQNASFSHRSPKFKLKGAEWYFSFSKVDKRLEVLSFALCRSGCAYETVVTVAYKFSVVYARGYLFSKRLVDTFHLDQYVGTDFNLHETANRRILKRIHTLEDCLQLRCSFELLFHGCGVNQTILSEEYFQDRHRKSRALKMPVPCNNSDQNNSAVLHTLDSTEVVSSELFKQPTITSSVSETAYSDGVEKLVEDLKVMLLSGRGYDVTLKVKEMEFHAHKGILISRSQVLLNMFERSVMENEGGIVEIVDFDPETFSDFLLYLYTGTLENLTSDNVVDLYRIADRYCVRDMAAACARFMQNNLTVGRFCDFLILASRHSELALLEAANTFFSKNLKDIIVTAEWKKFIADFPGDGNELFINALTE